MQFPNRIALAMLLGSIFVGLGGCATVGRKIDVDAVNRIEKGKTTRQQVLASIGSPDQVTRDGDGNTTYTYMYMRSQVKAESFIPIYGDFAGGTNTQNQTVIVTFGKDDIVTNLQSTMGGMETGENLSAGSKARITETEADKRPK